MCRRCSGVSPAQQYSAGSVVRPETFGFIPPVPDAVRRDRLVRRMDLERVALFDAASGGHHDRFVRGVAEGLAARGKEVIVFSSIPRLEFDGDRIEAVFVRQFRGRALVTGYRAMRRALGRARALGVGLFVDLNLDKHVWGFPPTGRGTRVVHVLHHAGQYTPAPSTLSRSVKRWWLKRRLVAMAVRGERFLVHTPEAEQILGSFLPVGVVARTGYPVCSSDAMPPSLAGPDIPQAPFLFVGGARRHKGLHVLVEAVARLGSRVRVVGPQTAEVRAEVERLDEGSGSLDWVDRFVGDEELREIMASGTIVVAPYTSAFEAQAAASGVLLDALSVGAPLVTTTAIASQLPSGYGGAVVVDADDPAALEEGLGRALAERASLSNAARREGRPFVAEHHTYEPYIDALLALVDMR